MSNLSEYAGDALLEWIAGTTMPAAPSDIYVSLWNGDPENGGTEITGTIGLTAQAVTFTAPALRAMENTAEINFGTASGSATCDWVALADNATYASGEQICAVELSPSVAISDTLAVKIAAGDLVVSY